MTGIDHLASKPLWSESVYLDAVSPDGTTGFVTRLCRYPDASTAWVWAHVFTPERSVSFNDSRVVCSAGRVAVEDPDIAYEAGEGSVLFRREGARAGIRRGLVRVEAAAHVGSTAPDGPGTVPLRVEATFVAGGVLPGAGNIAGRTEEHGTVTVAATWPGGGLELTALGQWHEQHQDAPRFRVPFTYITVRGDGASLVSIIGPKASGGIVRRHERGARATAVQISPPGPERELAIDLDDGSTLTGSLRTVHRYAVPIYGRPRPGTLVTGTLGEARVSGCVNDWTAL